MLELAPAATRRRCRPAPSTSSRGFEPPRTATAATFPDRPGPRVAICMATYEPPADLLRAQLESIRRADARNWVCLISDDGSSAEAFAALLEHHQGRPALRRLAQPGAARLLPELRAGAVDGAGRCGVRDPLRPGRPLAPGQAGAADRRRSATRSSPTATRGSSAPMASWSVPPTGRSAATTTRTSPRWCSPTPSPGQPPSSAATCSTTPCRFPPRLAKGFHDHWLAVVALARWAKSPMSTSRSTTTSSTAAP